MSSDPGMESNNVPETTSVEAQTPPPLTADNIAYMNAMKQWEENQKANTPPELPQTGTLIEAREGLGQFTSDPEAFGVEGGEPNREDGMAEIAAAEKAAEKISPEMGEGAKAQINESLGQKVRVFLLEKVQDVRKWYGEKKAKEVIKKMLKENPSDTYEMRQDLRRVNQEMQKGNGTKFSFSPGEADGRNLRVQVNLDPKGQRFQDPETMRVLTETAGAAGREVGGSYVNYLLAEAERALSKGLDEVKNRKGEVANIKGRVSAFSGQAPAIPVLK